VQQHRDPVWLLGERVKELTLLHEAAKLLDGTRAPDAALFAELAALIPPAWVAPEICSARIRWGNLEARTPGWAESPWMLTGTFADGAVDVAYREAGPLGERDAFLDEERALLRSLCEMLGASLGRYRAEQKLREREARLTFLHQLADALAAATDLDDILRVVVDRLGKQLGASRVVVAHVEPDNMSCSIPVCYTDGVTGPVSTWELTPFGSEALKHATAPIVVRDVMREFPPDAVAKNVAAGVRAMIVCSSVRHGALRSLVAVHQSKPRDWTAHEVELVSDTVSRAWAAIEQRAAEVRLRRNEELLRIAGETARVGGWSIDLPDYRVTWSDEVCSIHDVPRGTTPRRAEVFAHYAAEQRDRVIAAHDACIMHGTAFDLEAQIVTAGKRKWVRVTGRAERNGAGGEVVRIQGALQDIEDERRIEDHLRQTQKMEAVGQLSAGIVHDFNNIISVIQSYTALLIAERSEDSQLCDDLIEIQRAGQRASELTRRLLTFSKQQVHQARRVDLKQLVEGMATMLRHATGALIKVQIGVQEPLDEAFVDPGQVEQILLNLVVNARDAMPNGGTLTIELGNAVLEGAPQTPRGRFVMISVRDTGHGMDESTRARIFEPFFTTKEPGKGTGLGLATVHGIVAQSGGHIEVESALGQGTTFRVYLPEGGSVVPREPVVAPSVAPASGNAGDQILLVDDEDALLTLATRVLMKLGYRVSAFTNPAEAVEAFRKAPTSFRAVVTDVVMYPMSGFDLVRALREIRPDVPVVITSGYFRQDDVVEAGTLGLRSLVVKPDTVEELGRALHVELGAS
jgi:signal transduction histidine kinase